MKVKTEDLIGIALDWSVAKCLGKNPSLFLMIKGDSQHNYSSDWSKGGNIIDRENISITSPNTVYKIGKENHSFSCDFWRARIQKNESETIHAKGVTPLMAAMRCYVASVFGEYIEIPDELI